MSDEERWTWWELHIFGSLMCAGELITEDEHNAFEKVLELLGDHWASDE